MNKLWLLLLIAVPLQFIHAQEVHHAPTVEQCQAAYQSMSNKMMGVDGGSFPELESWGMKMVECESVDKQRSHEYHVARDVIVNSMYYRLSDYVTRHNLMGQFLAEDAQGKR